MKYRNKNGQFTRAGAKKYGKKGSKKTARITAPCRKRIGGLFGGRK